MGISWKLQLPPFLTPSHDQLLLFPSSYFMVIIRLSPPDPMVSYFHFPILFHPIQYYITVRRCCFHPIPTHTLRNFSPSHTNVRYLELLRSTILSFHFYPIVSGFLVSSQSRVFRFFPSHHQPFFPFTHPTINHSNHQPFSPFSLPISSHCRSNSNVSSLLLSVHCFQLSLVA